MNHNLCIILPLPPVQETAAWKRLMPEAVFPGGLKNLAVVALENLDNFDDFVSDAFIFIEGSTWAVEDHPAALRHQRRLARPVYLQMVELMLDMFYHSFIEHIRPILGPNEYKLERVLSWHPINGICVELSHGRPTRLPGCWAR